MPQFQLDFKKTLNLEVPIEISVCKPKSWAIKFYDQFENENNIGKKR